ncbi:MAG TPA: hypothetical protein VN875_05005 [Candidatus Binatus sp.]|jgi:hypothetical protein|nr:hypothetical protein [Candidatus Binatus sp.]
MHAHGRGWYEDSGSVSLRRNCTRFILMRGFPDVASREPMKAKFCEGELWNSELEDVLMPMQEKYEVVVVEAADGLVRW